MNTTIEISYYKCQFCGKIYEVDYYMMDKCYLNTEIPIKTYSIFPKLEENALYADEEIKKISGRCSCGHWSFLQRVKEIEYFCAVCGKTVHSLPTQGIQNSEDLMHYHFSKSAECYEYYNTED